LRSHNQGGADGDGTNESGDQFRGFSDVGVRMLVDQSDRTGVTPVGVFAVDDVAPGAQASASSSARLPHT
jgi:hypothetical protein